MPCELCEHDGGALIWRNDDCRVVLVAEPGYRGYCRAIWNSHVREMTDLPRNQRNRFMDVVFAVESVLRERVRPEKVNLASLGNLTPHLHWHVIPRFGDDPHFPGSVWSEVRRPPGESHPRLAEAGLGRHIAERLSGLDQGGATGKT